MEPRHLTESQARALWERAARLQAEAAARELGAADDGGAPTPDDDGPIAPGYGIEVVRRAAEEAGIAREFVDRALLEMGTDGEARAVDRWADRLLGEGPRVARVERVLRGSPHGVYDALRRVFPQPQFGLTLSGTRGGPPLEGGTLLFDVPGMNAAGTSTPTGPIFDIRYWADIKQIHVRLESLAGDPPSTRLVISAPLAHSRRTHFWAGTAFSAVVGGLAALAGGAVAAAALPATALAVAGTAGVAGIGGLAGMGRMSRPLFRSSMRKGVRGMERLLDAVEVDLQTDGAFTPAPRPLPPGAGSGGSPDLLGQLGL